MAKKTYNLYFGEGKNQVKYHTLPTFKAELETLIDNSDYKKDLKSILGEWKFDNKEIKTAQEFLNNFKPWINEQLETKKDWKDFLTKYEVNNLEELATKLDKSQENHLNYLQELQEKQEIEFKLKELEGERGNWLTPYLSKITDLESQLLNLAKQKLTNQKEAQELVKQLENNWNEDKKQHEQDRDNWSKELAKSREINSELVKDKKGLAEQIKNLTSEKDKLTQEKDNLNENLTNTKKLLEQSTEQEKTWQEQWQNSQQEHNEQLRQINLLFDENAKDYTEPINFNGLLIALKTEFNHLKNYRPRFREYYLKSINFLETKVNEFTNWLNENPERKANLSEWEKVFGEFEKQIKEARIKIEENHADFKGILNIEISVVESVFPYDLERKEEYLKVFGKWAVEVDKVFTKEEWEEREKWRR